MPPSNRRGGMVSPSIGLSIAVVLAVVVAVVFVVTKRKDLKRGGKGHFKASCANPRHGVGKSKDTSALRAV